MLTLAREELILSKPVPEPCTDRQATSVPTLTDAVAALPTTAAMPQHNSTHPNSRSHMA